MKSILRENSIIPDTEEKEFKYNYCRKIFTRKTFDTHIAKRKNTRRTTRSKSNNHDSSKNISVINTFTDIGEFAVTALMGESNNNQDLSDWNEVVIHLCLNDYVLSLKEQEWVLKSY